MSANRQSTSTPRVRTYADKNHSLTIRLGTETFSTITLLPKNRQKPCLKISVLSFTDREAENSTGKERWVTRVSAKFRYKMAKGDF
jgi:hypothetical protein